MKASKELGKNIRLLRKSKKLTLNEFAKKINKSVSTMSKYENGDISMDIDTLCEIAETLEVNVEVLIDDIMKDKFKDKYPLNVALLEEHDKLYMYYLNTKNNKLVKNMIVKVFSEKEKKYYAKLYMNINDLEDKFSCDYFYYGEFYPFDSVSSFHLENQANKMEKLTISFNNPFSNNNITNGIMLGIYGDTMRPGIVKILVSAQIIEDDEILNANLKFSKEELKDIKKQNAFSIDRSQLSLEKSL